MSEEGQFKMDKLYTGRSFPESKPDKYMSYLDGMCQGEETLTHPLKLWGRCLCQTLLIRGESMKLRRLQNGGRD
jgi:hypothetical protein